MTIEEIKAEVLEENVDLNGVEDVTVEPISKGELVKGFFKKHGTKVMVGAAVIGGALLVKSMLSNDDSDNELSEVEFVQGESEA